MRGKRGGEGRDTGSRFKEKGRCVSAEKVRKWEMCNLRVKEREEKR